MAYNETTRVADSEYNVVDPATTAGQRLMRALLQLLKPLSFITSGTGRLSVDVNAITGGTITTVTGVTTVSTVTTVATVTAVTNVGGITNIGGLSGFELQYNTARGAYAQCVRSRITI